jgi:signal transduction histidine kinase
MVSPSTGSIPAEVVRTGRPIQVDAKAHDSWALPRPGTSFDGPLLFVPLWSDGAAFGTLGLARSELAVPFDAADLALLQSYATQASVILERARAHQDALRAVVLQDEERIAHDLLDSVIHRLFAIGLILESAGATQLDDWSVRRERIQRAIDELDATIHQIRSTAFNLQSSHHRERL